MLQQITGDHFRQLLNIPQALYLSDGSALPVVIESVTDAPKAQMSDTTRMPFGVALSSPLLSEFIDGPCTIDLPELGRTDGFFVCRTPELGRDPTRTYLYISFN